MSLVLALALLAEARPLSLADALAAVDQGATATLGELGHDQAAADLIAAKGAYDPLLSASASAAAQRSRSYFTGVALDSSTVGYDGAVGVSGQTGTGTAWSVTTDLALADTTSSSLIGAGETQIRSWTAGAEARITQDLLAGVRQDAARIGVRTAGERLTQAELARAQASQAAISEVAGAWWAWWLADVTARRAADDLAVAAALEERTRAWYAEGRVARLEVDRVSAARLAAERDLLVAQAAVRSAGDTLLVRIGEAPGQVIEPAGSPELPAGEGTLDAALSSADAGNLTLQLDRSALEAARLALRDAQRAGLPGLDATAALGVSSLSDTASVAVTSLFGDEALPSASAGVSLTVPLGGRAARGGADRAAAAVRIAEVNLADDARRVQAEVRAAVDAVDTAARGLALSEAQLAVSRSAEDGERARLDEGVARTDQLLDATAARVAAEEAVAAARVALAQARLTLAQVQGVR